MTQEQGHGNAFERLVIERSGLHVAGMEQAGHTALHDIPLASTRDATPISVKVAQADIHKPGAKPVLAMGDAPRFFASTTQSPLLFVAGLHTATPQGPMIYEIHTCLALPEMQADLWGDLSYEDLRGLADRIKAWAKEDDADGITGRTRTSERALKAKRALWPRLGYVDLSPKISASEARLQCSIPLLTLRRVCLNHGSQAEIASVLDGATSWRGIPLPMLLPDGKRTAKG